MRYELTNEKWVTIKLLLPNEPRGVPRVNTVVFSMVSSGSCDLERQGIHPTCIYPIMAAR
jgi:transposase